MEKAIKLDKQTFLCMAKIMGLEETDPHLQQLYPYVQALFPSFKVAEGMDLGEIEPMPSVMLPGE